MYHFTSYSLNLDFMRWRKEQKYINRPNISVKEKISIIGCPDFEISATEKPISVNL